MTKRCVWLASSVLVLALTPSLSYGQAIFGSIFGTVTDPQGAAVANATITVTDVGKGTTDSATTNDSGNYSVTHLIPDVYSVKIEAQGFKTFEQTKITVSADQSQRVDAQVQVGSTAETLEVTSEAPQLQTDRADVSISFNQTYVEDLPTFNRNFTQFELMSPGTQKLIGWSHAATENPQGGQQIFVNGQHFSGTGFELDGTDNQDPILGIIVINPNLDAVTETKVALQDFDAEKGNAVAGNVSAQTKSGSNQLHGSAFWFRRTDANQARDPFTQFAPDPTTGRSIPSSRWQQFGGSVGGAIIKDKLFFFGDYQGTRQEVGITNVLTVPTALVQSSCTAATGFCNMSQYLGQTGGGGDLSSGGTVQTGQIFNPNSGNQTTGANRTPFAGNLIPVSMISQQAKNILALFPAPNVAGNNNGTLNNYVAGGSGPYNQNAFDTRIDWTATPTINVFGRYSLSYFNLSGGPALGDAIGGTGFGFGGLAGESTIHNYNLATGITKTFSPTFLADFRFGWLHYNPQTQKFDAGTTPAIGFGIPGLNITNQGAAVAAATSGLPAFFQDQGGVATMSNFGTGLNVSRCNCPLTERENQYQFVENFTKIRGNHQFKFGGDVRYATNLRVPSDANRTGQLTFSHLGTSGGDVATGTAAGLGGIDMATFLLGDVSSFSRYVSTSLNASEHQYRMFFYGQDNWRITPKLNITYGLRWELYTPEAVNATQNGGFANIVLGSPSAGDGVIRVAGVGPYGLNGNIGGNYHSFAPRLGFAYQLYERTVIRGGIGTSYDIGVFGSNFGHTVTQNLPVLVNQNLNAQSVNSAAVNNNVAAFTLSQGPPAYAFPTVPSSGILPLGGPLNNVQPKVRPPTQTIPSVTNYNLTVEQQLTKTMTLSLAYVGNVGRHGFAGDGPSYDANPVNIAGFGVPGITQADRQYFNNKFAVPYQGQTILCCAGGNGGILGDYLGNNANTNYNSLQVKATQNVSHGLQFITFYTWSRALHYDANYFAINPNYAYGPWDQNRNQTFVMNAVYALPFGKGKMFDGNAGKVTDAFLGGWQVTGTLNWSSGLPFTPSYGECGADEDTQICRPNKGDVGAFQIGGSNFNPVTHVVQYFTPAPLGAPGTSSAAFIRPAAGTLGDAGFDALYGPRYFTTDMSIMKNFSLTEQFKLQFRMDAFNIFNHPVLGFNSNQGNLCVDCVGTNAGQVTDIEADTQMRALQFALRLTF